MSQPAPPLALHNTALSDVNRQRSATTNLTTITNITSHLTTHHHRGHYLAQDYAVTFFIELSSRLIYSVYIQDIYWKIKSRLNSDENVN